MLRLKQINLPQKKVLLYGIPLIFTGILAGTILTLSIPHSHADPIQTPQTLVVGQFE